MYIPFSYKLNRVPITVMYNDTKKNQEIAQVYGVNHVIFHLSKTPIHHREFSSI